MRSFALYQPTSVLEACELLELHPDEAVAYAGGTELLTAMKLGYSRPRFLVDLKRTSLDGIRVDETGALVIGATTTHRTIETSTLVGSSWPVLTEMERQLANVRIRNQGTLGGNLCFAEPHADPPTALVALEARFQLAATSGSREVEAERFWPSAFETAIKPGEVLAAIVVPGLPSRSGSVYLKFGMLERPTIGVAIVMVLDSSSDLVAAARIAVGAVAPNPRRFREAEGLLVGVEVSATDVLDKHAREAAAVVARQLAADDSLYGSADYKRQLALVLVRRGVLAAVDRARRNGQASGV